MTLTISVDLSIASDSAKNHLAALLFFFNQDGDSATYKDIRKFKCPSCKASHETHLDLKVSSPIDVDKIKDEPETTAVEEEEPETTAVEVEEEIVVPEPETMQESWVEEKTESDDGTPDYLVEYVTDEPMKEEGADEGDSDIDYDVSEEELDEGEEENDYELPEEVKLPGSRLGRKGPWKKVADYFCGICNKTIPNTTPHEHRRQHYTIVCTYEKVLIAEGKSQFLCLLCHEFFQPNMKSIQLHVKNQHPDVRFPRKFECNICEKLCTSSIRIRDHLFSHSSVKQYKCELCPFEANSRNIMLDHKERHEDRIKYVCKHCERQFKSRMKYSSHYCRVLPNKGVNRRPKECRHCGQLFKSQTGRDRHENTVHKETADFLCSYCDKRFKLKDYLKVHERIHTGVKPYNCKYCCRAFSDYSAYFKHQKKCAGGNLVGDEVVDVKFKEESNDEFLDE